MEGYVSHMIQHDMVKPDSVKFTVLKFHEEHGSLLARISAQLAGKHVVVQCEQGVDFFVEPVTSEWFQDNYEDNVVHEVCMAYAEREGVMALVLQTNSGLDLPRGIDRDDLDRNIYGHQLETDAYQLKIEFKSGMEQCTEIDEDTISKGESNRVVVKVPDNLINLAVTVGLDNDKKAAFRKYLNFDPADFAKVPRFYASYMAYSAAQSYAPIPVAGILELISYLLKTNHDMPWRVVDQAAPAPQWMLACLLRQSEVPGGHLRILKEFREAGLPSVRSLSEYLSAWMYARSQKRVRRNTIDASSRFLKGFWQQLLLGKDVSEKVMSECPDFCLWRDGRSVLQTALEMFATSVKEDAESNPILSKEAERVSDLANKLQPEFELCCLWLFLQGAHLMILDFTCRLLGTNLSAQEEFDIIKSGLPDKPSNLTFSPKSFALKNLLTKSLVAAWNDSDSSCKTRRRACIATNGGKGADCFYATRAPGTDSMPPIGPKRRKLNINPRLPS